MGADAARDNGGKGRKIGVAVDGDAVHRDPAFDLDSDGADLFFVDPDSAVDVESFAVQVEFLESLDDGLFEVAHPAVEVLAMFGDVEDGVGDELSGAVIGYVTAAVGGEDLDSFGLVPIGWVQQVFGLEAGAEGEDGVVFKQEEGVLGSGLDLGEDIELAREGVLEGYSAERDDVQHLNCGGSCVECANLLALCPARLVSLQVLFSEINFAAESADKSAHSTWCSHSVILSVELAG